jgi:hypothetical protein
MTSAKGSYLEILQNVWGRTASVLKNTAACAPDTVAVQPASWGAVTCHNWPRWALGTSNVV